MKRLWNAPPPPGTGVAYRHKQRTLTSGRTKGLAAIVLALVFVLAALPALALAEDGDGRIDVPEGQIQLVEWSCLSGDSRHDTMAAISQAGFEHADTVVVASSENFPDALSATALAGFYGSPVLLTSSMELTQQCAAEIERLGATKAIVVGGSSAISGDVFDSIEDIVGEGNVVRLAGDDRYATSQKLYEHGRVEGAWGNMAVVVSGTDFADALSMSPWTYAMGAPIFLADGAGALSADAIEAIRDGGFDEIVIAGGVARISDATEAALAGIVGEGNVVRLAGHTRYDTSQQVVAWAVGNGLSYEGTAVATGSNFPDALSGGALCGSRGSVLMLVGGDESEHSGAVSALHENRRDVWRADVLGGQAAVSDGLYAELQRATLADSGQIDFSKARVDLSDKVYTGFAIEPAVAIEGLVEGRDFEVSYEDNVDAGTATVTVTGIRGCGGERSYEFEILPANIASQISITAPDDVVYDGLEHKATVSVGSYVENRDYTVSHTANVNAGRVAVTVAGCGNYTGSKTATFDIAPYDISKSATLAFENDGKSYSGGSIGVGAATVRLAAPLAGGIAALGDGDYTLIGATSGTDAGTYTAYAAGKGNFTGTVTGKWAIAPATLTAEQRTAFSLAEATFTYDGAAKQPGVTNTLGLVEGRDFTVGYSQNTDASSAASEPKAIIAFMGNYAGNAVVELGFAIDRADISSARVTLKNASFDYNGALKTAEVEKVVFGGKELSASDYSVGADTATKTASGDYLLTIEGQGNYAGTAMAAWKIVSTDKVFDGIALSETSFTYDGKAKTPEVIGMPDDVDYAIDYLHNTDAGIATAVVTTFDGKSKAFDFAIAPKDISSLVTIDTTSKIYDGKVHTTTISGLESYKENTDYTVSYTSNVNAGKVIVKVAGCGNYTGTKAETFEIEPYDISNSNLAFENDGTVYTGSTIEAGKATVTLDKTLADGTTTLEQGLLTFGTAGELSAKNAGTYTAYAVGRGNFTGSVTGTWTIAQADVPSADLPKVDPLKAYIGTLLSEVALPEVSNGTLAWSSGYGADETVGDTVGETTRTAVYTPNDANYKAIDIEVSISVKADTRYTVVYHSNGGTLSCGTADTNGQYSYTQTLDESDKTSTLTANQFTYTDKTFQYWTLGAADEDVATTALANSTLTYTDGHKLANGSMYTNTSTYSTDKANMKAAKAGDTIDLYAHWADSDTDDYWIASAAAAVPDSGIVMSQDGVDTEVGKATASGTSTTLKGYMDSDEGNDKIDANTMHLFTYWTEDKVLPLADRYVEFRVVQVGQHDSDGSAVTFMAVHSLPTAQMMKAGMDGSTGDNSGGWGESYMRETVMEGYVAANMPEGFVDALKAVAKKAYSGSYGSWDTAGATVDSIWLMSAKEITGAANSHQGDEGSQYRWFSDRSVAYGSASAAIQNLYLDRSGSRPESLYDAYAWLRSPRLSGSTNFRSANPGGDVNTSYSSFRLLGVCPAFCMAADTYTVTFDANGGTFADSQTMQTQKVVDGGNATALATNPTNSDSASAFDGWYTSNDGGTTLDAKYDFANTAVTADITLYAKWSPGYTVVYHSNGGTLANATEVGGEYTYTQTFLPDDATSSLTLNKFTYTDKTFQYWTLGAADSSVTTGTADAKTMLTYVDGHSLIDGNGMYTDASTKDSKTKATVGTTVNLYAHWADSSTDDYWIASAAAAVPDSGIVVSQDGVDTEVGKATASGTSTTLKGYMDSDEGNDKIDANTMHLFTYWTEDKVLPLADRYVEFRVVQVGQHDSDGSAVTFMAVHSLPTAQMMKAGMDGSTGDNSGGWGESYMRETVMEGYVAANMPEGFVDALKAVAKKAYSGSYGSWDTAGATVDSIWLMSAKEITGAANSHQGDEGSQYRWFSDRSVAYGSASAAIQNLYLDRSGSRPESLYDAYAWLRSPRLSGSTNFRSANPGGDVNTSYSSFRLLGVCPAFCM